MERVESVKVQNEIDSGTLRLVWNCVDRYRQIPGIELKDTINIDVSHTSKITIISVEDKIRIGFNSVRKPKANLVVITVEGKDFMLNSEEI